MDKEIKEYIDGLKSDLQKAISAGYGYSGAPGGFSGSTVLQQEDLDATMRSITVDMKAVKLWNQLSTASANSLVHQYNRKIALGPQNNSPYTTETGIADESDSKYIRVIEFIRFFSKTRKYSIISTKVNMVEDPEQIQINDGTAELIKDLERELYFGLGKFMNKSTGNVSASLSDLPRDTIEMRGIYSHMIDADNDVNHYSGDMLGYGEERSCIRDMQGASLSQGDIEDMAVIALENFGMPNVLHSHARAISQLVKSLYSIARTEPGLTNQTIGYSVSSMATSAGNIRLETNIFLMPLTSVIPSQNMSAPSIAGVNVVASAVVCADLDPKRTTRLAAGVYKYTVNLVSNEGYVSQPIVVAPVTVADGDEVRLTLTGLPANVRAIKVSRSAPGGARAFFVGQFSVIPTNDVVVDRGHLLPQTGEAFMLDISAQNMEWRSLMPLTKLNLAMVDHSKKFSLLMAGTLVMFTPRFNSLFINLGN